MSESIVISESRLPTTIEDLSKFVLVGREKLNAVRAEIRAIEKVGLAKEVHEQKLKEAQAISEAVLDAEVRIGELMQDVPKADNGGANQYRAKSTFVSNEQKPKSEVIRDAGLTQKQVERFQTMAAHPEIIAQAKAEAKEKGEVLSRSVVLKKIDDSKKAERKAEKAERKKFSLETELPEDMCRVFRADIREGLFEIEDNSVDFIITDPPYPREYLPLFGDLSRVAARVLKPNGSLIVMSGQSYLPEVIELLRTEMKYHWCMAYTTFGGQSPQLFHKKVNTFWKPVLWFVKGEYSGDWVGDVLKSAVNDNDKRFHEWGQSYSGMKDIVERFTNPNDTILDPFLGGGTTGVVAVCSGRKFIGSDVEQNNVDVSLERIKQEYADARS